MLLFTACLLCCSLGTDEWNSYKLTIDYNVIHQCDECPILHLFSCGLVLVKRGRMYRDLLESQKSDIAKMQLYDKDTETFI